MQDVFDLHFLLFVPFCHNSAFCPFDLSSESVLGIRALLLGACIRACVVTPTRFSTSSLVCSCPAQNPWFLQSLLCLALKPERGVACTILYYTILYYNIPYYTIAYHNILYHSTITYHTMRILLFWVWPSEPRKTPPDSALGSHQRCTVQCNFRKAPVSWAITLTAKDRKAKFKRKLWRPRLLMLWSYIPTRPARSDPS